MIINSDIFKVKCNNLIPYKGCLLISDPFLHEKHFNRSVILMIEYEEQGGMGLILNKESNLTLDMVIQDLGAKEEIPLFCGGPVSKDRLFYIHSLGNLIPGSIRIGENLYIDGDFEIMLSYIRSGNKINGVIKFFVGYSGWDFDQLNKEIEDKSWVVAKKSQKLNILNNENSDNLWKESLLNLNTSYHKWINFPINPSLN